MTIKVNKFSGKRRPIASHEAGNVSMIFAMAAIPLVLAGGAAIDYIGAMRAQTQMQAAVDGASLAVAMATSLTDAERRNVGKKYFSNNFNGTELADADNAIKIVGERVTVSASFDFPTSFMLLAGIGHMKLGALAEVDGGNDRDSEVVLVLDYSLSMVKNDKYIRMRDAATKMIDQLVAGANGTSLKFGIVPFSAMVRTSMPKAYVTQASTAATWTGCTQDRKHPYNTGVSAPTANDDTKWGYIDNNNSENAAPKFDCAKYQTNKLDIMPLSADAAAVKSRLAVMYPVGNTNIPLGAEFGWNLLDPGAPFTEGAAYADDKTKKFLVLLTDGVQTSRHWGADGNRSVANGNDNLKTVCKGMAAKGITIFAIAYDIMATAVTDLLKACAPDNYFEPDNTGAEIDAVFKAITKRIRKSTLRLAR
jgi:Flp pilus assembly protein TadG